MVEVILLQSVQKLGEEGSTVKVRPGFARNYLLPQGLAFPATEENQKRYVAMRKKEAARIEEERVALEQAVGKIKGLRLVVQAKVGEEGRLYGSVGPTEIVASLLGQGIRIPAKNVVLEEPIKALGDYDVTIRLSGEQQEVIKLTVDPEPAG